MQFFVRFDINGKIDENVSFSNNLVQIIFQISFNDFLSCAFCKSSSIVFVLTHHIQAAYPWANRSLTICAICYNAERTKKWIHTDTIYFLHLFHIPFLFGHPKGKLLFWPLEAFIFQFHLHVKNRTVIGSSFLNKHKQAQ